MPLVTLLTDFGTADGYVAEMKGVILSMVPAAHLIDLSHDIAPYDVDSARLALARCWRRFPPGTVHLVIVDPGVGTQRAALAIASGERFLVGPDNGILSPALLHPGARAVRLPVPADVSHTFHGRDVFAPAAAALARGDSLESLGRAVEAPVVLRTPEPEKKPDGWIDGVVIHVDRFGNAVTNIMTLHPGTVSIAGHLLPLSRAYGDVDRGEPVALLGSSGLLEVAVRDGHAAEVLGLVRGSPIRFRPDR